MRLSPTHVASLLLSGTMATTVWLGLSLQRATAQVMTAPAVQEKQSANAATPKTEKALPVPTDTTSTQQSSKAEAALESETSRQKGVALKANKKVIEPIEPFIKADAVAVGQWLMTKKVKTLVEKPNPSSTTAAKAPAATTTAKQPAATKAKPVTPAEPASQQLTANTASHQQAASPPPPSTLPQVAVQALPPKPSENPTIDDFTEMRVALTKQASNVAVAASNGGALISASGEFIENVAANVGYRITADDQGLRINGNPVPTAVWLEPDNGGYVAVGDRWYRGRLLLLWQNGGVMAVNHVLLREYLYSVVGAEMSASWTIEALKAQAVAARSYAIVHTVRHQRRTYDLDDTQRYQAYKGITTEASSTQQAVHETAGEFISYDGGIVESLYAANQDIVDDAHSGFGMSQMGALDLAEQGYRYYEILSAYYPETSVGRIDVSN
ncbi:MAG: SpoIID/LytB domain-containing protein [Cyanobacteria bacterium J06642_11]